MIGTSILFLSLADHSRRKRKRVLEIIALEDRCLLSAADMVTRATVKAITNGVATVEPMKPAYAINAGSVQVDFTADDPDHPGVTPTIHYNLADLTAHTTVSKTGSSVSFSAEHEYQVQYWATDGDDPQPAGLNSILIAIDRTPPVVTVNTASPNILWPPNGKFVTVTVTGTAVDHLSGVNPASLHFAVTDEYGRVHPSGSISEMSGSFPMAIGGFETVNFSFQVSLQARRFGYDFDGRQYSIDVSAQDMAGNLGTGGTVVTVPHDMGHHVGTENGGNRGSSGKHNGSQGSGGNMGTGSGTTHGHGHGHRNAGSKATHGNGHGHGQGQGQSNPAPTSGGQQGGAIGSLPNQGNGNGNQGHGNGKGNGNGNQGNGNGHGHGGG